VILKYNCKAQAAPDIVCLLSIDVKDHIVNRNMAGTVTHFLESWKQDKLSLLPLVRELEKAAMNKGYCFAVTFTTGSCMLCKPVALSKNSAYPQMKPVILRSLWTLTSNKPWKTLACPYIFL
jgi:predicted metal-binding protein